MIELLLILAYSLIFILLISKIPYFQLQEISSFWVISAFVLKILAGFLLTLIYTLYYTDRNTADIFKYFDDSKIMYDSLFTKPLDYFKMLLGFRNDSAYFNQYYFRMNNWCGIYPSNVYGDGHILIRFNASARLLSLGYYSVHALFMSFLSFIGLIGMFKVFSKKMNNKTRELFFLLFFFPSIVLWTSGVLKEGLIFFSLGLCLYLIDLMLDTRVKPGYVLLLLFSLLILRYTKFYLFIILLPLLTAYSWNRKKASNYQWINYLGILFIVIILGFILGKIFPVYDGIHILVKKQHDFIQLARESNSGSLATTKPLPENFTGILLSLFPGFLHTLSLPYPWEIRNIMMIMPALENIFMLLFLLLSLVFRTKPIDTNLFWLSIMFSFLVLALIGMISPVIGAMVRYRIIAIPFYFNTLLLIWNKERTIKFLLRD